MIGYVLKPLFTLACISFFASPSVADVKVSFIEGAPKDKFVITNTGNCDLASASIRIDLSGSASGLVFDVTSSGPGVETFQPFELVSGGDIVASSPTVSDGDSSVTLDLSNFSMGQSTAFTIDVDDTTGNREITVSGSEILDAIVS